MKILKKGFTLIEVLVAVAILVAILTATMLVSLKVTKIIENVDADLDSQVITSKVFGLFDEDLSNRLVYAGAPFLYKQNNERNDEFFFYVRRPSYQEVSADIRDLSLIHYYVEEGKLYREAIGTVYSSEPQVALTSGHLVLGIETGEEEAVQESRYDTASSISIAAKKKFADELAQGVLKLELGFAREMDGEFVYETAKTFSDEEGLVNLAESTAMVVTIASVNQKAYNALTSLAENDPELWDKILTPFNDVEGEKVEYAFGPSEEWNQVIINRIQEGGRLKEFFQKMKIQQFIFYPN